MQKNWYRQGTDLLKEIRDTKLSDDTLAFPKMKLRSGIWDSADLFSKNQPPYILTRY